MSGRLKDWSIPQFMSYGMDSFTVKGAKRVACNPSS